MTLTFDKQHAQRLLDEAEAASVRRPTFAQLYEPGLRKTDKPVDENEIPSEDVIDPDKIPSGLWLVGDHGVYLMSNARTPAEEKRDVAYANEVNPDALPFDEWWANKAASFGRDDGIEFLEASLVRAWIEHAPTDVLHLKATPETLEIIS